ncbi:MAG: sugar-transfer associated ATP-grasp domain-containing protein [Caldicoprobacterales bacterium]
MQKQTIPNFGKVIEDAYTQHFRIPYFKMVSWDYAIDYEGNPVLIEANIPTGQIDFDQLNIGPILANTRTEFWIMYIRVNHYR